MALTRNNALMLAITASLYQTAIAQTSPQHYAIAAGPLTQTMATIARQNKVSLSADPKLLKEKYAVALNGYYDVDTAFEKALQGTGLILLKHPDGKSYSLKIMDTDHATSQENNQLPANPAINTLPVIQLNAQNSPTDTDHGYTTAHMATATKLNLSMRETPQSVMVVTQQMLEDRKMDEFENLMQKVTGINVEKSPDGRVVYYARGFNIDYYLFDGMPISQGWYTINNYNMDLFDRVEIVKGANGLLAGAGSPAASLNMIRKHADSKVLKADFEASAGRWDQYKFKSDIQTPLSEDGRIRGRLVTSYKDKDSFIQRSSQENSLFYGVIDADLSDQSTISFGSSYEENNTEGVMGGNSLPAFLSNGQATDFKRSKSYMLDWSRWNTSIHSYFFDAKHTFDHDISLKLAYFYNEIDTKDRIVSDISGTLNPDGSGLTVTDSKFPQRIKKHNIDLYLSIPFELGKQQHELIAGLQYNKENDKKYITENAYDYPIKDYFQQNGSEIHTEKDYGPSILSKKTDTEQKSAYITGKFTLLEQFKLILGSRLTHWDTDSYNYFLESSTAYKHHNVFTPFVGVVYDLNSNHSLYASYTDIFQPQNFKNQNGTLLDPKEGNNYEIGIKGEYFDQRLNAALSVFRLKQDNVAEVIDGVFVDGSGGSEAAYRGVKGVNSKGVEVEIAGKVTEHLDINAGFAHFEAKDANKNKVNTTTPRNNINLFAKYSLDKWSLGAGVNWKSKGYSQSNDKTIRQSDFAIVDIMAAYDFSNNISGQLNINNLFDKKYYSGYNTANYYYAEPLSFIASIKYKF